MPQAEQFDVLVLGSGQGGKLLAWHLARSGRRTAVVERRWIGGSCPNIACLPSKNEIWSAKVAQLAHHAARFGTSTGRVGVEMAKVRQRKRDMVAREVALHLENFETSGAELIMGSGNFVAAKTLEVRLNGDGGRRLLTAGQVFLNIGTHAAAPSIPGLEAARPLTHIEALELDYLPSHLIVLGGGYVGLELAQAYRRFGSRVTIVQQGPQLMAQEDPDIAEEMHRVLNAEGAGRRQRRPHPRLHHDWRRGRRGRGRGANRHAGGFAVSEAPRCNTRASDDGGGTGLPLREGTASLAWRLLGSGAAGSAAAACSASFAIGRFDH